jgi:hypothetical protein
MPLVTVDGKLVLRCPNLHEYAPGVDTTMQRSGPAWRMTPGADSSICSVCGYTEFYWREPAPRPQPKPPRSLPTIDTEGSHLRPLSLDAVSFWFAALSSAALLISVVVKIALWWSRR